MLLRLKGILQNINLHTTFWLGDVSVVDYTDITYVT